jgi:hypothetical protein
VIDAHFPGPIREDGKVGRDRLQNLGSAGAYAATAAIAADAVPTRTNTIVSAGSGPAQILRYGRRDEFPVDVKTKVHFSGTVDIEGKECNFPLNPVRDRGVG